MATKSKLPTIAQQAAVVTTASAPKAPRYYGAACLTAELPAKWAAVAQQVLHITNPAGLAKAQARYTALGQSQGAAYYAAMQQGVTVQQWANTLQQAGQWGATVQLVAKGAQHPTMFLNAAIRNKWVVLRSA